MKSDDTLPSGRMKREDFVSSWPGEIVRMDSVASTQEEAKKLAENGAPEGTAIMAEEQTGGRGRMGRKWHSRAARESG